MSSAYCIYHVPPRNSVKNTNKGIPTIQWLLSFYVEDTRQLEIRLPELPDWATAAVPPSFCSARLVLLLLYQLRLTADGKKKRPQGIRAKKNRDRTE